MRQGERGQVSIMIVGFFVLVGLLVVAVVNSSAAFLQHQELNNLVDGAALAAADALQQESVYEHGVDAGPAALDPARAREIVGEYLAAANEPLARWRVSADGNGIHVHLERVIEFALAPPGWSGRSVVSADATAQLRVPR